jgi:hypothetical protein
MHYTTPHILMVRPNKFGHNEQTAATNAFQHGETAGQHLPVHELAQIEFDGFVHALQAKGANIVVVTDSVEPHKPDAIFPNNWVTFHEDGTVVLYPMCTPNRRWERRRSIIDLIGNHFQILNEIDFSHYEEDGIYLEGTGSMVFDKVHQVCYACLSARTHAKLLALFCEKLGYQLHAFTSVDPEGKLIYHTNVMMSVAEKYAIVCLDSVSDPIEKEQLVARLRKDGKQIIEITYQQMFAFCGNVLEIADEKGNSLLAMSERAYQAFTPEQLAIIQQFSTPVYAPLYTIENIGGGGARCMMAEIFLPEK